VRGAVLLDRGDRLHLVSLTDGKVASFRRASGVDQRVERRLDGRTVELPAPVIERVLALPPDVPLFGEAPLLVEALTQRAGRPAAIAEVPILRSARALAPAPERDAERSFLLALARSSLARALRSPEEVLITLAREEERTERALGREERAAESFVEVPGSPYLEEYARSWRVTRAALGEHHARLRSEVEQLAIEALPNLSAVVGPRIAARLLAAAGSVAALGRMRAPRLQLLGSRRRPSPDRGPRYGLLFRADRMEELPLGRRGAYARSLAALAVIAARADATTRRPIASTLIARRDRRVETLRRKRR
jgi:hypothetical protein